ncbi:PQQ-binding-like beta-propeller repeat protein [Candidatus Poribacteria bacterium]|nr:PQQ-binding-like beta-propeller repeat protein [Candidatus Poribacteria bacterium]MYK18320.1 PQQ-binding-like beta-propeller repeat protein [Candidatus Poribacteria bacterium]
MYQTLKNTLICLLAVLVLVANSFAGNWHQWRGPNNDGISQATEVPLHWSQTENVQWRLPLPGEAGSTPVVSGNKIFLTSAEGDALVLMCISTKGEELWRRTIAHGNRIVRGGEGNSAAPSPVTDGEHVWAFFGTGDLVCYDFQGNEVWHTNIAKRYGRFNLYFVMASTPLLDKDRLYMHLIHSNAWLVLALDKMTGEEVWKHNRKSDATEECEHAYTSPILYRDAEREYLVVHGADYVTAHSLEDGGEIWRCGDLNPKASYNYSLRFVATPVATEGLIVVPSAKNGPVVGIDPAAQGDVTNSKWQRWKLRQGTPDVPSPVIHDGLVYLCRENGDLICLDAETGEQLYRERTHRHRHRASPVYANGYIYLTSRDGVITVVKTGREFKIVASNSLDEVIAASPVITDETLYLRTYQALYAIGSGE